MAEEAPPGAPTIGRGKHLFESIESAPHLRLLDVTRFDSDVLTLVYAPK